VDNEALLNICNKTETAKNKKNVIMDDKKQKPFDKMNSIVA